MTKVVCSHCGIETEKEMGHYNRSISNGNKFYCSQICFGLGRRKTNEEKKKTKAEYDKKRREKLKEQIKAQKKEYYELNKKEIYRKQRLRKDNDFYRAKHAEYCRRYDQRAKEKINRYKRVYGENYLSDTKVCISCNEEKNLHLDFDKYNVFPDGRLHICSQCESLHKKAFGYSTRGTMTAMVMRRYTNLTREDIAKHPYLIEANKFLILLKQLVK